MESPDPPQGYRKSVGICLINSAKKIFAGSRTDKPNVWQMPQGGINEGEDPRSAAIRELKGETGISSAKVIAEVPYWLTYDWDKAHENIKGQTMKWFLFKFTGKEEEINLLGDGTAKAEFGQWSWMSPKQVVELVGDSKKSVYKKFMEVFAPYFKETKVDDVMSEEGSARG